MALGFVTLIAAATLPTTCFFDLVDPPGPSTDAGATSGPCAPDAVLVRDAFGRSVAEGWGTPEQGPAYQYDAMPPTAFSVDGSAGVVAVTGAGSRFATFAAAADVELSATVSWDSPPTGESTVFGSLVARLVGVETFYEARIIHQPSGEVALFIVRVADNVGAGLAAGDPPVDTAWAPGKTYGLRLRVQGTTIAARAWIASEPEPTTWLEATDTSTLGAGPAGVRAGTYGAPDAGEVTADVRYRFDDLLACAR